jgi:hypothetical protein
MSDMKLQLGIEAGDAALKLSLFDPQAKKVLKTSYLPTETSPLDDIYTFETTLQSWLQENDLESIKSIALTVSVFRGLVRQVYIPPEASSSIRDYLSWTLSLMTNIDPDVYYFDYHTLNGDASLGYTVLLIAVRRVWVDAVRKGFRSKKIAPTIFELDVVSLYNLLEYDGALEKGTECLIKADFSGVTIMWMAKDDLKALRCVSTLELVDKSKEEAYLLLSKQVLEQLQLADEENGVSVKRIRLCGELTNDITFVNILREQLNGYTLTLLDSFANIRLPVDDESTACVLNCVGAIGASLRSAGGSQS